MPMITAEVWGGPEDGTLIRTDCRPFTIFTRLVPDTWTFEESTYALEVLEDGRFRWKHIATSEVA